MHMISKKCLSDAEIDLGLEFSKPQTASFSPEKSWVKSRSQTGFWQKPKLCGYGVQRQSCVRGPTFKEVPNVCAGSAIGENAGPATWLVLVFGRSRRVLLIKKASVGPTRAQQVHRIWATKTLCGPRTVRMRLIGTLQQL